jgi:exopolyphosphatase/guanosine-5'-triphosphate,3'-diphosphate pyrophosphatase
MKKTRLAIIDLGTNSVRFDIHELYAPHKLRLIHREKLMVRLGENVFVNGKLDNKAIQRTLQTFLSFKRTCRDLKVDKLVAFGTSALREAEDSDRLLLPLRKKAGIDVRIISGREEAKLIAQGILKREKAVTRNVGLVDIGGGSTEISLVQRGKITHSESFPLGAARLQQLFLKTSPPHEGKTSVHYLRKHVRSVLKSVIKQDRWPKPKHLMGSSGTIRTLSRIAKRYWKKKHIERDDLSRFVDDLTPLTVGEICLIPGMEVKRSDLILAGTVVFEECMRVLECDKASATDFSLREGILDQELHWIEPQSEKRDSDFSVFLERASQYGINPKSRLALVETAHQLFKSTYSVHKLKDNWGYYLMIAAIFKDAGRSISPIHYPQHSYYIVKIRPKRLHH